MKFWAKASHSIWIMCVINLVSKLVFVGIQFKVILFRIFTTFRDYKVWYEREKWRSRFGEARATFASKNQPSEKIKPLTCHMIFSLPFSLSSPVLSSHQSLNNITWVLTFRCLSGTQHLCLCFCVCFSLSLYSNSIWEFDFNFEFDRKEEKCVALVLIKVVDFNAHKACCTWIQTPQTLTSILTATSSSEHRSQSSTTVKILCHIVSTMDSVEWCSVSPTYIEKHMRK